MAPQDVFEIAEKQAVVRAIMTERSRKKAYEIDTSLWIWTKVVQPGYYVTIPGDPPPYLLIRAEYHQRNIGSDKAWGCTMMAPQYCHHAGITSFLNRCQELQRFLQEPVLAKAARDEFGDNRCLSKLAMCNPLLLPIYTHLLALIDHGQGVNDPGTITGISKSITHDRFSRFVFDQIDQFSQVL